MARYKYDPTKHGDPHDAFDLDRYYYVVRKHEGKAELLVFKKQAPNAEVDVNGS